MRRCPVPARRRRCAPRRRGRRRRTSTRPTGCGAAHRHPTGRRMPRPRSRATPRRGGRRARRRRPAGWRARRRSPRVPGQRARLVDGSVRREQRHDLGASPEGRGREPAAHDLPERHEVGGDVDGLEAPPARPAAPEPRHHLVGDEQGPVLGGDAAQYLGEPGLRRDDAHVAGSGLGDDARDPLAAGGEDGLQRLDVVVGDDERLGGHLRRHARRVREGQGRDARPGAHEERVDVPVVVPGELHDEAAPGEPAREPDGAHRRLGAAGDQAHLLDRADAGDDLLGEGHLVLGRRPEGEPALDGPRTASSTAGCACPRIIGPQLHTRSTSSRPSASVR